MTSDTALMLDLWEMLKEHVTEKQRTDAAHAFLTIFEDHGMDGDFAAMRGEDKWIDEALVDRIEEEYFDADYGEEEDDEY